MKIAVTGKGGVGKTTFSATIARLYAEEGRQVLAADVDPDAALGLALGFSEEELDKIIPITKMRKLVEERTGANAEVIDAIAMELHRLITVILSPMKSGKLK